jgi:hypothetical protein
MSFTAVETASGTLTISTVATVTFGTGAIPIRYAYVVITNDTATGSPIYATTNGVAPTVGGADSEEIQPGASVTLANSLAVWDQGMLNVPVGTMSGGTPGTPQYIQPYGSSLVGGIAGDPGTSVQLISAAAQTYTVTGTG